LAALAFGASTFAQAQQGKVGVINIQMAIVSTKDGQKAAADLQAKNAPKQKSLEGKQNEINSLKDQLQKGQNALSDTAKNELVRNIDAKTKSFNRDMEDAQAEAEQDQQKVLQDLGGRMMAVIDKYAKDNGYTLVLDVSSPQTPVLFASNTIDITKDIIELYDKNAGPATTSARPAPATGAPAAAAPRPMSAAPSANRPAPSAAPGIKK
jgi:outer membrane protein